MKTSKLKQIIVETIKDVKEELSFEKKLKNYLNLDVHSGNNIPLQSVFGNENIEDLIKKHPDKFSIPKKYTPANMYFWRGFALPLSSVKTLGPFTGEESLKGNQYLVSYGKNFKTKDMQSFTTWAKVAIGFADYSAGYVDEDSFNPKTDEIPVIIGVEYSPYKNDFFGNPEYFGKIGKHGNEGEVFFKGSSYKADVFIPIYVKKYIK